MTFHYSYQSVLMDLHRKSKDGVGVVSNNVIIVVKDNNKIVKGKIFPKIYLATERDFSRYTFMGEIKTFGKNTENTLARVQFVPTKFPSIKAAYIAALKHIYNTDTLYEVSGFTFADYKGDNTISNIVITENEAIEIMNSLKQFGKVTITKL